MEISVLALLGIGLATMFFGYFFGLFEGRGQGYKRRKKEESEEGRMNPIPPVAAATPIAPPRRNALLELEKNDTDQPRLFVDGREVDPTAVAPETRRRLIDLMVMLRPWVDPGSSATSASVAPTPVPAVNIRSVTTPVAVSRIDRDKPTPAGPTPASVGAATSLVGQIDSLLQIRLAGSPLAERGIHLGEAPHGGAIVFVGTEQYEGVDKVPDAAIQSVIRAAIAEWEEKFPPR